MGTCRWKSPTRRYCHWPRERRAGLVGSCKDFGGRRVCRRPILIDFTTTPTWLFCSTSQSLILRNTAHTGPVRGLDFNPIQTNLLASGGVNGEVRLANCQFPIDTLIFLIQVYIWDLKDPSKPYSPTPGARSTKLDEITSVAWNQQVQYVLAGASSTGYTVVWDLRGKRKVVALAR